MKGFCILIAGLIAGLIAVGGANASTSKGLASRCREGLRYLFPRVIKPQVRLERRGRKITFRAVDKEDSIHVLDGLSLDLSTGVIAHVQRPEISEDPAQSAIVEIQLKRELGSTTLVNLLSTNCDDRLLERIFLETHSPEDKFDPRLVVRDSFGDDYFSSMYFTTRRAKSFEISESIRFKGNAGLVMMSLGEIAGLVEGKRYRLAFVLNDQGEPAILTH